MFLGWFGLVDVLSICCVEEINGVVDERLCFFVIIVFFFVLLVLIDGLFVFVIVGVDVDEVVVDFVIFGVFVIWLFVFLLGFIEDFFVVVIVRLDVVVVFDFVEMFDFVVLFVFIIVDCVVGIFVVVEILFVGISVVDGLIDVFVVDMFVVMVGVDFVDVIVGFVVNVVDVVELSDFDFVVMGVVWLFVVGVVVLVFVVGVEDDDNDVFNIVVDFVDRVFVFVDFSVVDFVIVLVFDVSDDNVVDGEDVLGVIVVVFVVYKRNYFYVSLNFDIKFFISKLL